MKYYDVRLSLLNTAIVKFIDVQPKLLKIDRSLNICWQIQHVCDANINFLMRRNHLNVAILWRLKVINSWTLMGFVFTLTSQYESRK